MKTLNRISINVALMGLLLTPSLLVGQSFAANPPEVGNAGKRGGGHRAGEEGGGRRGGPMQSEARMKLRRIWRGIGRLEEAKTALTKTQAQKVVALVEPWTSKKTMTDTEATQLASQLSAVLTTDQKQELEQGMRGQGYGRGEGGRGEGPRDGRGPGGAEGRGPGGPEGRGQGGPGRGPGGPGRGPGGTEGRGSGGPGRGPGGPEGRGPGGSEGRGPGGPGRGGPGGAEGRGPGGPSGPGRGPGGMDGAQREKMRKFMSSFNPFYAPTGYAEWKDMPERMQKGLDRRYKAGRATLEALSRKSR